MQLVSFGLSKASNMGQWGSPGVNRMCWGCTVTMDIAFMAGCNLVQVTQQARTGGLWHCH
jgi:hypothetical protein